MRAVARVLAALGTVAPAVAAAQDTNPAAPSSTSLTVSASFPSDRFIAADTPIAFTLTRPIGPSDGPLALVVGGLDVSALTEQSPTAITYRPRTVRLPSGENEAVVYLVNGPAW